MAWGRPLRWHWGATEVSCGVGGSGQRDVVAEKVVEEPKTPRQKPKCSKKEGTQENLGKKTRLPKRNEKAAKKWSSVRLNQRRKITSRRRWGGCRLQPGTCNRAACIWSEVNLAGD